MKSEETQPIESHPLYWSFKQYLNQNFSNNNRLPLQWQPNRNDASFTLSGDASHKAGIETVWQKLTDAGYNPSVVETETTIILKLQAHDAFRHFTSTQTGKDKGRG